MSYKSQNKCSVLYEPLPTCVFIQPLLCRENFSENEDPEKYFKACVNKSISNCVKTIQDISQIPFLQGCTDPLLNFAPFLLWTLKGDVSFFESACLSTQF